MPRGTVASKPTKCMDRRRATGFPACLCQQGLPALSWVKGIRLVGTVGQLRDYPQTGLGCMTRTDGPQVIWMNSRLGNGRIARIFRRSLSERTGCNHPPTQLRAFGKFFRASPSIPILSRSGVTQTTAQPWTRIPRLREWRVSRSRTRNRPLIGESPTATVSVRFQGAGTVKGTSPRGSSVGSGLKRRCLETLLIISTGSTITPFWNSGIVEPPGGKKRIT